MWCTLHGVKSRKQLLTELRSPEPQRQVLASCYRGGPGSGVLWSVVEVERPGAEKYRVIRCDLLQYRNKEWWYKPMVEAEGPFYYSCPLKYLKMVPESSPLANVEWRKQVKQYYKTRNACRLIKSS